MNKLVNLLRRLLRQPQERHTANVLPVPGKCADEPQEWTKRIARIHALIEERKAAQRLAGQVVDRDAA